MARKKEFKISYVKTNSDYRDIWTIHTVTIRANTELQAISRFSKENPKMSFLSLTHEKD